MIRTTQKELKKLKEQGVVDLSNLTFDEISTFQKTTQTTKIAYSAGKYGRNGLLLLDDDNIEYVIIGRTTALFMF